MAKGFCILLVVINHVAIASWCTSTLELQATSFKMPLYFILSGLFFKLYENFGGFLKRKINKLLIPFLFFFIVTSILPCAVMKHQSAIALAMQERYIPFNNAIWFLLCLFEVNLMFYLIHLLSKAMSTRYQTAIVMTLTVALGFVGLGLGINRILLPFYLDTALSALPFFAFGYWLFRHTGFMAAPVNWLRDGLLLVACVLIIWYVAIPFIWIENRFPTTIGPLQVYLCGIAGTMMVLIVSKILKHLPLVSFWGRYSIIILCTHQVVITFAAYFLRRWFAGSHLLVVLLAVTLLACHLLILFMRRFMPHVTAQKDVIRIG
ncbi:MAG: acyltransferase family protein [Muribaculaceae bacterium]|nr:acyltransferase family protein [Muribaculaceae bacterium]